MYVGADPSGELVALKWLHPHLTDDAVAAERFAREVAVAQRVAPFCTAKVLGTGVHNGRPYIASEYVEGRSLHQVVKEEGPRTGSALHRLAIGTATALAAIHQAGIVHRDFSPSNVLLAPDGPRVIDFGIARALEHTSTITSTPMGTPAYMSPEQIMGGPVSPAADMFSWAGTIAFASSGTAPFAADSVPAVINRVLNVQPDLSAIDGDLREVVAACLAKDPAARPTAQQVIMRLLHNPAASLPEGAGAARPGVPAAPPYGPPQQAGTPYGQASPWSAPTHPPPRRGGARPWVVAAVAAAVALVATVVAVVVALRDLPAATTADRGRTTPATSGPSAATTPPAATSAPVPAEGLTESVLPDAGAKVYSHPSDPITLAGFSYKKAKDADWVDYAPSFPGGTFRAYPNYLAAHASPDGRYLALRTTNYTSDDYDSIQINDTKTGKSHVVKTVKSPLEAYMEGWSRDGTRLLLNVGKHVGDDWHTSGFGIIDVRDLKAPFRAHTIKGIHRDASYGFDHEQKGVVALTNSVSRQPLRFYTPEGKLTRTVPEVGEGEADALFSPSGRLFVTDCPGMSSNDHCVYDTASGQEIRRFSSACTLQDGWYDESHLLCWTNLDYRVVDFDGNLVRRMATFSKSVGDRLLLHYVRRTGS